MLRISTDSCSKRSDDLKRRYFCISLHSRTNSTFALLLRRFCSFPSIFSPRLSTVKLLKCQNVRLNAHFDAPSRAVSTLYDCCITLYILLNTVHCFARFCTFLHIPVQYHGHLPPANLCKCLQVSILQIVKHECKSNAKTMQKKRPQKAAKPQAATTVSPHVPPLAAWQL